MAVKAVKDIIAGDFFRPWREAHAYIEQLQQAVDTALAAQGISPDCCRVERLARDDLYLSTVAAAAAVRIKQILPTLQQILKRSGYSVASIRVTVVRSPD